MATVSVIDQLKKTQILELLEQGKRVDGRALDEPRKSQLKLTQFLKQTVLQEFTLVIPTFYAE